CASCRAVSAVRVGLLRHRAADVVIAVSDAVAAPHRAAGIQNIRVVYNPLPDAPGGDRPPARRPPVFGYLGQLVDVKGVRTLLAAAARLPRGSTLVVGGTGPLAADAERAPGVDYRGWLDGAGKEQLFSDVDCLVVPSEWYDPA